MLSEDDSGNEQEEGVLEVADDGLGTSSSSKDSALRKRKCNMEEEGDEKRERNSTGNASTSSSETSDSEVENMAADVERHFTSDDV